MRIKAKMMAPGLRPMGVFLRAISPTYSIRKFKFCNWFLDTFFKGHAFLTKGHTYQQIYIPRPDGTEMRLCLMVPRGLTAPAPALLWLHGGGYAMGQPEQDSLTLRRFIDAAGCVVAAPDYRRSMDAPFPAALEDGYLALLWLKEHCQELGARSDQIFLAGSSAGGGLTACLSLYARDRGEVSVAFQMPLYPMLDDSMACPSCQNNDGPVWDSRSNELAWELYLGRSSAPESMKKYASPSRETDFSGLPPTLTFVGGIEPFRDETAQYVKNLRAAGVKADFEIFEGGYHAFDLMLGVPVARRAQRFYLEGLRYAAAHYFKAQPEAAGSGGAPDTGDAPDAGAAPDAGDAGG